jgi:hypothetical protein
MAAEIAMAMAMGDGDVGVGVGRLQEGLQLGTSEVSRSYRYDERHA